MNLDFNSIPKFCISLKRSAWRRETVEQEFYKHGIKFSFFDAVDKKDLHVPELSVKKDNADGVLGCAKSHIELIKKAKDLKLPAICVFEDDIIFCEDFKERIKYIENLLEFDFDILCLGGHFPTKEIQHKHAERTQWQNIYKVVDMGGTYAYIITEKCYDYIINNWQYNYGADEFYANFVYGRFNSYAFVPFLVGCKQCTSEITDSNWEYDNIKWHFEQGRLHGLNTTVHPNSIGNKINFLDVTFIIPVKIESFDREFNFMRVIQYLCDNFATNIVIAEQDTDSRVLELLKRVDSKSCNIKHTFERNDSDTFHRTRLLNEMLSQVKTLITVNYDIDVLMHPESYIKARELVLNDRYDLVYPFHKGVGQKAIDFPDKQNYNGQDLFDPRYYKEWGSLCGHCQFFYTKSYIDGGMENEEFISYGAEDRERMERFTTLGYKVTWLENSFVYHLEHERGKNSSVANPYYGHNENLYKKLSAMYPEELIAYYSNVEYLKKYK